ncbi:recombinase RecT [Planobispora siamensis]|uniref:Uncharacterized protein n=1 Tax=Planobispora siamensis TaxID=936338 RepID=A0A8J3SNA3_9ACTN|nr:recombinase RecT [Planobispora siamensis]GIH95454.1 hypothetical protein Psi01_60840 [Planobispora siamensis]
MTVVIDDAAVPVPQLVGPLTIQPGQSRLTPLQAQAFRAISNFDPRAEPASWPHINVFLQLCIELNLSPWSRKIHLYRRGEGEHARYVIQTGIHGLTELAQRTGRFIRWGETVFTSADDTPAWWHLNPVTGKRERVWVSTWVWPDTHPAAARTTICYYDGKGTEREMTAEVAWQTFAPYQLVYEGHGEDRRKVIGADGVPLVELEPGWSGGKGIYMLAKCSRANILRLAFPAQCGNVFIDEELHAQDARVRDEAATQVIQARAAALAAAQHAGAHGVGGPASPVRTTPRPVNVLVDPAAGVRDGVHDGGRAPAAALRLPVRHIVIHTVGAHAEAVHVPPPTPAQRRAWALAELTEVSTIIGRDVCVPIVRRYGQAGAVLEDVPTDFIVDVLGPLRAVVAVRLRELGRHGEAAAYAGFPAGATAPVAVLFGHADGQDGD